MQLHFQMTVTQPVVKLLSVEQAIRLVLVLFSDNNTVDLRHLGVLQMLKPKRGTVPAQTSFTNGTCSFCSGTVNYLEFLLCFTMTAILVVEQQEV